MPGILPQVFFFTRSFFVKGLIHSNLWDVMRREYKQNQRMVKMEKPFTIFASVLLISVLSACNLEKVGTPGGLPSDIVATNVVLTLAAFTQSAQQTPLASPTLEKPTNTQPVVLEPTVTPTITLTPTMTLTMTPTLAPTDTPIPKPGTIEGAISGYPYGSLPRLTIVAYGQEPPYNYSYWITAAGNTSYSMTSSYLIPGKYQVVAYDSSNRTGGCPIIVTVISEQTVTCDITNWGGGYPAKPSGVPNP
jgi:hypothetical protein